MMDEADVRFNRAAGRLNAAEQSLARATSELIAARREYQEAARHSTYAKALDNIGDLPTRPDYPR